MDTSHRARGNIWRCSTSGVRNKGISASLLPAIPRKLSSIQWKSQRPGRAARCWTSDNLKRGALQPAGDSSSLLGLPVESRHSPLTSGRASLSTPAPKEPLAHSLLLFPHCCHHVPRDTGGISLPRPPLHTCAFPSGRAGGAHQLLQPHPGLEGTGSQSSVSPPGPGAARPGSQRCSSPGRHWMGLRNRSPAQLARPGGAERPLPDVLGSSRVPGWPCHRCRHPRGTLGLAAGGISPCSTSLGCWVRIRQHLERAGGFTSKSFSMF